MGPAGDRPEDLWSHILKAAVENTDQLETDQVNDIMVGCSFPEAEQGLNICRVCAQMAGFPDAVSGSIINRFCSSGLEAIAISAMRVMTSWSEITIGGGVESMSIVPMAGNLTPHLDFASERPDVYISMGLTAENIARRYGICREDQDAFAYESYMRAAQAQEKGWFTEVVPTPATRYKVDGQGLYRQTSFLQSRDDGVRPATTLEGLAALQPVFAAGGSVTAGNSSQTTDGAAAAVIASGKMVKDDEKGNDGFKTLAGSLR